MLVSEQWQHGRRKCSVNSRCHSVCWVLTSQCHHQSSASNFCQKNIHAHSSIPAGTDVDAKVSSQHPRLMSEMKAWHSGIPHHWQRLHTIYCRTSITSLCGTCVQCPWSSHFRKEKSSPQETSQESIFENEQYVLWLTVFDCRTLCYVHIQLKLKKQQLKYHCLGPFVFLQHIKQEASNRV